MSYDPESKIINSWKKNVDPWIRAVRDHEIETRQLVTNKAIVDAILYLSPKSVIDIGCGEGWLVRELVGRGVNTLGIDVIREFVESAKKENSGRYRVLNYDELSYQTLGERFDMIVCNFSLFGSKSVESVFHSTAEVLNPNGVLVIQTLHPDNHPGEVSASEGWVEGSWSGFSREFCDPAPWYYRPLESWIKLFTDSGFEMPKIIEPANPITGKPASIIFVGNHVANC